MRCFRLLSDPIAKHLSLLGLLTLVSTTTFAQSNAPVRPAAPNNLAAPLRGTNAPPTASTTAAADTNANATAAPAKFELPASNDPDLLVDFLAQMITFEPQTQQQMEEYQRVAPGLMDQAAHKVLQIERDKSSDNYRFAAKYLLAVEAMNVQLATPARQQEMFNEIKRQISDREADSDDLDIAITYAEGLEMAGNTKVAYQAYLEFSSILLRSKDPLFNELGNLMAGAARRLDLVGNPIEVTGKQLDGRPFQWHEYRGKVVLIDFWATWCGPCLKELPEIRKAYDEYRHKGFDVVSINMDTDRAPLDEFLKKNPAPWTTLFEGNDATNPTAMRYGISALPTAILVDAKGNVVSMEARGEELTKQLEQLLGKASVAKKGSLFGR